MLMGSGILTSPRNPLLNMRKTGRSAAQRAHQLPITEFAHKAANGERTITCRDRHCPKCQSLARAQWLEDRQAELLDTQYFHVVFTVPQPVAAIALQNKQVVYNILFRAAGETLRTIAADPKHLGAQIGFFAVLHTWGQTLSTPQDDDA